MKHAVLFVFLSAFLVLFSQAVYAKTSLKSSAEQIPASQKEKPSPAAASAGPNKGDTIKPGPSQNKLKPKALATNKNNNRLSTGQAGKNRVQQAEAKQGQAPSQSPAKILISDKTGLPIQRKLSSGDIKNHVSEQIQPLFQICELRGKTTKQKTTLFIKQLHKIREYTINSAYDFIGEDRGLLRDIQAHLDHFLDYMGDWTKKSGPMNISEMHHHFEHTYRYRHKVPENVQTSAVAPWWIKQILAGISCLNRNQNAVKKET